MKLLNSVGGRILIFLIILAAAAGIFISVLNYAADNQAASEDFVPEGVPVIEWSNGSGSTSMRELTEYLKMLTPRIAVKNSPDFEWQDICSDHFWVRNFSVTTYENAGCRVYSFIYSDDAEKNQEMTDKINAQADDIINKVRKMNNGDKWDDILAVHDELICRTEFVSDSNAKGHIHDIYGALVEHKAVCQGYTYAFGYILQKMGYDCKDIYSKEHIWSRVDSIDSAERYIDVTWDDYNKSDRFGKPYIHHDFFCITKEEMELFDEHEPEKKTEDHKNTESGDNYYKRKGCYIKKGDIIGFQASAMEQFKSGKNLLEFRFESPEDFNKANEWTKAILSDLGYEEKYYIYTKSELQTFSAGLYIS